MEIRAREHQLRAQALDALIAQALLEKEATARGVSEDALEKAEIVDKAAVSDAEAKAFYEANKARIGSMPEAEALKQIKDGLAQQRQGERRAAFARELRSKYDVKVLLEPYRVPVELGDAPVRGSATAAGHDRRVLRLPVPVLRARAADRREGPRDLRRQGALGVPPLPAELPRQGGEGRRGGGVRRRPGQVLGDARPAVGEHREARGRPTSRSTPWRSASTRRTSTSASTPASTPASSTRDKEAGQGYGVSGTPAFFVNGRPLVGAQPFEAFQQVIDDELQRAPARRRRRPLRSK